MYVCLSLSVCRCFNNFTYASMHVLHVYRMNVCGSSSLSVFLLVCQYFVCLSTCLSIFCLSFSIFWCDCLRETDRQIRLVEPSATRRRRRQFVGAADFA